MESQLRTCLESLEGMTILPDYFCVGLARADLCIAYQTKHTFRAVQSHSALHIHTTQEACMTANPPMDMLGSNVCHALYAVTSVERITWNKTPYHTSLFPSDGHGPCPQDPVSSHPRLDTRQVYVYGQYAARAKLSPESAKISRARPHAARGGAVASAKQQVSPCGTT